MLSQSSKCITFKNAGSSLCQIPAKIENSQNHIHAWITFNVGPKRKFCYSIVHDLLPVKTSIFRANTKMTYLPERNSLQRTLIFDLFQSCRLSNNLIIVGFSIPSKNPLSTNYGMKHTNLPFLSEIFSTTFIIYLSFYGFYNIKAIYF